ncbi:MAG: tripartite tricarboxylate transporter substrate binding protein [Burkholderiales bacterium]|jgi:tripartite-type tricarboxylate transporter receptor subunit TctC|nr:tripartite tricarboxylate transporter substrate binding protein [Burkholderiales bacterium]
MRFSVMRNAAALIAGLAIAGGAAAQGFPSKPIRIVVPFAAGSATDTMARAYANEMQKLLGQPVIVDNKPGANGMIGAEAVARAAPDGYTLLWGTNSTNAANASLFRKTPYDQEKDFAPVAFLGSVPLIVAVNNDFPAKTLRELIAYAKANPDKISFAAASASQRVATEMLNGMAGTKMTYVPYKSSPNAITDLMSGQVQLFTADLAVTLPQVKAGKIRGLAVTSARRTPHVDLPTVAEAGGLPGYELIAWFGAFAPAGTPKPVVDALNAAITKSMDAKDLRDRMDTLGVQLDPQSPEWLGRFAKSETEKWAKAIRDAGIQPE